MYVIDEKTVISRPVQKTKPKTPFGLTGVMAYNYSLSAQKRKQEELEKKQARKEAREEAREEKLKGKNKGKSKKRVPDSSSSDESIDVSPIAPRKKRISQYCSLCLTSEDLTKTLYWIGCGSCPRWYHTWCAGEEYQGMSEEELEEAEFECIHCSLKDRGNDDE